jgi:hypothetical protein
MSSFRRWSLRAAAVCQGGLPHNAHTAGLCGCCSEANALRRTGTRPPTTGDVGQRAGDPLPWRRPKLHGTGRPGGSRGVGEHLPVPYQLCRECAWWPFELGQNPLRGLCEVRVGVREML